MKPLESSDSSTAAGPGDSRAASTADRLAQIALELFAERGYAGTSLAEIAKRLGIRKPSIYNYYSSKDELFMALFENSLDTWKTASMAPLDGPGGAQERLKRHMRVSLEFAVSDPHATALTRAAVTQVSGDLATAVGALLDRYSDDYRDQLFLLFSEAVAHGELPARDPQVLVLAWLAFKDGVMSRQIFLPASRLPYMDHFDELWTMFWSGLKAPVSS